MKCKSSNKCKKRAKVIKVSSVFKASKDEVFDNLKKFETLAYIAYPYMTFKPINDNEEFIWKEGAMYSFSLKLFGIVPFGIHKIKVIDFDGDGEIYTNETSTYVPVWKHRIILKEIDENTTEYTDRVVVYAGLKTYFVYLWGTVFYMHRQRKWKKLLMK